MKNTNTIISLVAITLIGATIYATKGKSNSEKRQILKDLLSKTDSVESIAIIDLFSQDEINTFYEVMTVYKYKIDEMPQQLKSKFDAIGIKYNIFT